MKDIAVTDDVIDLTPQPGDESYTREEVLSMGWEDAGATDVPRAKTTKTREVKSRSKGTASFLTTFAPPPGCDFAAYEEKFVVCHGDNFAWVPDNSVDLVLTDPPFNIAQDTNFHTWGANTINSYRFDKDKGWDTYDHPLFVQLLHQWSDEFARVLRSGGHFAIFCADSYVSHLMEALKASGLNPRRMLTWRKPNAVPINRQTMMMSACEYVIVGVKGSKATFNSDIYVSDTSLLNDVGSLLIADKAANVVEKAVREAVLAAIASGENLTPEALSALASEAVIGEAKEVGNRVGAMFSTNEDGDDFLLGCIPNYVALSSKAGSNRLHPTEKPVPLLRYLVSLLSKTGDVILDPFAGSGSTGEAALDRGRKVVLVERENDFYTNVANRINTHGLEPEKPAKKKRASTPRVKKEEVLF